MHRLPALFGVLGSMLFSLLKASGAAGITEVPLNVGSIVYDSSTDKIYASGTNNLLQLDPLTGKVLNAFFLGTNVTLLSLGAQEGIWAAIEDEQSVRRFDLGTLTAEDKIVVSTPGRRISDLYGSLTDPTLALVDLAPVRQLSTAYVIRNGSVLPDSQNYVDALAVQGVSAYLAYQNRIYRLALGPTGFGEHLTSGPPGGRPLPFGPYVYTQAGTVLDAISMQFVADLGANGVLAIDRAENLVFYLTSGLNSLILSAFSHPSLQKVSATEITGIDLSQGFSSFVAYYRHVAYNTASTLSIVDLDKLIGKAPSADLQVTQSAPESFDFASGVLSLTVGITNLGPSATDVVLTETISSGSAQLVQFFPSSFSSISPLVRSLGTIGPGQGLSYSLSIRPGVTGPFTNTVLLAATNTEPAQTFSTQIVNVVVPPGPVLAIRDLSSRDVAYDSRSGKLFAISSENTWEIDPVAPAILLPSISLPGAQAIEAPASGGALFAYFPDARGIQRFDTSDFRLSNFADFSGFLIDLLAAPGETHLIAEVGSTSTILVRNGLTLPNRSSATGPAGFSSDGTKFYLVNAADCVLNIFDVDQNGLTLVQTRTNAGCSGFTAADGLLYFDGGTIYDPVADKRSTIGLSSPVQMLARGGQVVDTLSRSNGVWTVRRFAGTNHRLVRSLPLTMIAPPDGISLFKPAGADRVAVGSPSTLYIIYLGDPTGLSMGVSFRDSATVVLRIDFAAGSIYRIETKSNLSTAAWTTLQDNIAGNGGIVEIPVAIQSRNAFFRVARQGQ